MISAEAPPVVTTIVRPFAPAQINLESYNVNSLNEPVLSLFKILSPCENSFNAENKTAMSDGKASSITGITGITAYPPTEIGTVAPITTLRNIQGHIVFRPIEARIDKQLNPFGNLEPYCVFWLGFKKHKGSVASKRREYPTWKDVIHIEKKHNKNVINLKVKDNDKLIPRTIGTAKIHLSEIMSQGKVDQWYFLHKKSKVIGRIRIIIEFEQRKIAAPLVTVIEQLSENSENLRASSDLRV